MTSKGSAAFFAASAAFFAFLFFFLTADLLVFFGSFLEGDFSKAAFSASMSPIIASLSSSISSIIANFSEAPFSASISDIIASISSCSSGFRPCSLVMRVTSIFFSPLSPT
jgi:hypothetical protein